MSLVDYQINDLIDNGKLLLERHDTLSTEIDEVMVIMMAERIIQAPGLTEVERQSISFIYLLSSVVVALVLSGLATDSAIEVVLLNKDLLLPILEHNSIESTDTLISNIICNLPSVDGTIELDNCATRIKNQVYVFFSMQTRRSLHQYEKATIALLSLESPEDYLTGLLQAERGLRMPSIAQKPNPILAVDRNGYRIRVYSGNQLNHDEKRITGAYRLGQYGDKRVDHDKNRGDRPQVPFFDSEAIFRHKLTTEPLSIFTGSEQEYHVFITEPDGRIVGYVCTEAPLSLDDDSVLFGTPRPPQLLYGLEKVFGASVLTDLANGELDSVPINKAIDIVRLAPRSNTDPEGDSLRNRDKVIIAFELGNALRALVSRFQDAGRTIAICDTELAKLEQIFYGLLGIRPAVSNNLPATTDTLPEPYNMLLRPRYDYERTGREVSVVAFELNILSSPESVERWLAVEELLWKYADAHSDEEKSRILGEIYLYAATHIIDAKLGKSEVNES